MDEFAAYAANTFLLTPAPKRPNNSRRCTQSAFYIGMIGDFEMQKNEF